MNRIAMANAAHADFNYTRVSTPFSQSSGTSPYELGQLAVCPSAKCVKHNRREEQTLNKHTTSSFKLLFSWIALIQASMSSLSSAWNRYSQSEVVSRNTCFLFVSLYEMSIKQALMLMGCSFSDGRVCFFLSLCKYSEQPFRTTCICFHGRMLPPTLWKIGSSVIIYLRKQEGCTWCFTSWRKQKGQDPGLKRLHSKIQH